MAIQVYELTSEKGVTCNRILRSLPAWFGIESAIQSYATDVESMPMLAADLDSSARIGFISIRFHNKYNAEMYVLGVLPEFHGKGVGSALVKKVENFARSRGAKFVTVKTLAPARPHAEYDQTRKFYTNKGFFPFEEFKTLWGEVNPCLLMIKVL